MTTTNAHLARALRQIRVAANELQDSANDGGHPGRQLHRDSARLLNQLANALEFGSAYRLIKAAEAVEEANHEIDDAVVEALKS